MHEAELLRFAQESSRCGLVLCTSGNASLRLDRDTMLLTASGAALGSLAPDQLSRVSLADGTLLEGPPPSMEKELHRQAYLARPEVAAVLHCQSRWATLLACHAAPPERLDFIPEVPVYVGGYATVPYALPGSPELAQQVARALGASPGRVVLLRNHGQVVVGPSWPETVRSAVFFELACWMWFQGAPLEQLGPQEVRSLQERYG